MEKGKIIFLNGVSSSGKTTLAKAIVKAAPNYFHMSIDDYDLFIDKIEDRQNNHLIPVETEFLFHRTITMFLDKGINLVVDHILYDEYTRKDFFEIIQDYSLLFVGVMCSLEELEHREIAREDRTLGLARKQLEYVHKNEKYDLVVDTSKESVEECLNRIIDAIN